MGSKQRNTGSGFSTPKERRALLAAASHSCPAPWRRRCATRCMGLLGGPAPGAPGPTSFLVLAWDQHRQAGHPPAAQAHGRNRQGASHDARNLEGGRPSTLHRLSATACSTEGLVLDAEVSSSLGGFLFTRNPSAGGGAGAPLQCAGGGRRGGRRRVAAISAWIGFNGLGPPSTIKEFWACPDAPRASLHCWAKVDHELLISISPHRLVVVPCTSPGMQHGPRADTRRPGRRLARERTAALQPRRRF